MFIVSLGGIFAGLYLLRPEVADDEEVDQLLNQAEMDKLNDEFDEKGYNPMEVVAEDDNDNDNDNDEETRDVMKVEVSLAEDEEEVVIVAEFMDHPEGDHHMRQFATYIMS